MRLTFIEQQANWLLVNTNLGVEKILDFQEFSLKVEKVIINNPKA